MLELGSKVNRKAHDFLSKVETTRQILVTSLGTQIVSLSRIMADNSTGFCQPTSYLPPAQLLLLLYESAHPTLVSVFTHKSLSNLSCVLLNLKD